MELVHVLGWNTIDSWKDKRGCIVEAISRLVSNDKNVHGRAVHLQLELYKPTILLIIRGLEGTFF